MKILAELPVKEALRKSLLTTETRKVHVKGRSFGVANLKVFAIHGCRCVRCGREGNRLIAWEDRGGGIHVDLFSHDKNGPVLMNRDHIIPRSKKGPNTDWNYQPMCVNCNSRKGNNETTEDVRLANFRKHWKKIYMFLHGSYWKVFPKPLRVRWLTKLSVKFRDAHLHKFSYVLARLTA